MERENTLFPKWGVIAMEGERLAELRKGRKIGQKEFAELMGISVSALSKYERNVNEPEDALKKSSLNISTCQWTISWG